MVQLLYQVGVSILLSYAAGKLLEKESESPIKDFKPTPTVERGSPVPLVVGRDNIAPMMLWSGSRVANSESVGSGGKGLFGGKKPKAIIWYEAGWHGICIGPARRLWAIRENGKVVFQGPIDPASHPSGTLVDLGQGVGRFRVYWGEEYQPVNTFLADADRIGIASKWPFMCYVQWDIKRLGTTPIWPRLKYEIEVWPYGTKLCATPSHFLATRSLVGAATIIDAVHNDVAGEAWIETDSAANNYKPSQYMAISGQTISDGDYLVDRVETTAFSGIFRRRIFFGQTINGMTSFQGTVRAYEDNDDDGINAAHLIYQLLFAGFPHGMGHPVDEYDIASLEALGTIAHNENLRSTMVANQFKSVASALADLMMDVGFMMAYNDQTGLIEFRAIRPGSAVASLPAGVLIGDPPEIDTIQVPEESADRKLFEFFDRARDYAIMPVTIDDDGQATIDQTYGQQKLRMTTVRDIVTASAVAIRRDQEDYSNQQKFKIKANRQARLLVPGQLFTLPGVDPVLICIEKDRKDILSGAIEISAIPNYYGINASNLTIFNGGGILPDVVSSDSDVAVIPLEIPAQLTDLGEIRFGVARIRASSGISGALIHLSADDVTYGLIDLEDGIHAGGLLDSQWDAGPGFLDIGPTITAMGPDIGTTLDLSAAADELNWQRGRQVAIVGSGTAAEIWFVRYVEALGGDSYRLREVLTGRFDTSRLTHAAGVPVVIMDESQLKQLDDLSLVPDTTYYIKSQPIGNSSAALDELLSVQMDIYGKGLRPLPALSLRAGGPDAPTSQGFLLGDDLTMRWDYRPGSGPEAASSGAGNFAAGDPVFARAEFDGTCRVRLLIGGTTEKRRWEGSLADFTLPDGTVGQVQPWADIATDWNLDPGDTNTVNYTVEVSFLKGTLQSSLETVVVTSQGGTAP